MRKAAIYDSQFLSSKGLEAVLLRELGFDQVNTLNPSEQLSYQLEKNCPDLLVMDYLGKSQILPEALTVVLQKFPSLKILVISADQDRVMINRQVSTGVHGFLTKTCSEREIVMAIRSIADGSKFYCQKVVDILNDPNTQAASELSEREMSIIRYVTQGLSSTAIADKLSISIHTVNSHRKNILKKLGLKSPTELILFSLEKGWIDTNRD